MIKFQDKKIILIEKGKNMIKTFYKKEEIEKYYDKERNCYDFIENNIILDVHIMFDLDIKSHIHANNILGFNINCLNISCSNIGAQSVSCDNLICYSDINILFLRAKYVCFGGSISVRGSTNVGALVYDRLSNW